MGFSARSYSHGDGREMGLKVLELVPNQMPFSTQFSTSSLCVRSAAARKQVRAVLYSSCNSSSESDGGVEGRNFQFNNKEEEALNMWELGKEIGVSYAGGDEDMVAKFVELENRDRLNGSTRMTEAAGGISDGCL